MYACVSVFILNTFGKETTVTQQTVKKVKGPEPTWVHTQTVLTASIESYELYEWAKSSAALISTYELWELCCLCNFQFGYDLSPFPRSNQSSLVTETVTHFLFHTA